MDIGETYQKWSLLANGPQVDLAIITAGDEHTARLLADGQGPHFSIVRHKIL